MAEPRGFLYAVILLAALSVMITAVSAVGYYSLTPIQVDVALLKGANKTLDQKIDNVDKGTADALLREKTVTNDRFDAFKADLNARIAEINRILEHRPHHVVRHHGGRK